MTVLEEIKSQLPKNAMISDISYEGSEKKCVPPFRTFAVGIQTNEEALCKIAFKPGVKFDEMPKDFGGTHQEKHSIAITAPTLKAVADGIGFWIWPESRALLPAANACALGRRLF